MPRILYDETNVLFLCELDPGGNILPRVCFD